MYIFSERLKDLRIENGYKQEEMANILNITTSAYGYYEQGRNEPSLEMVKKICMKFEVSADYLLGSINTPNHQVHYSVAEGLSLNEQELEVLEKMEELHLLKDISQEPIKNVERLHRYWEFIKKEIHEI
ncbi:helix-turn-helix domain-containing protein [Lentibacillus salicampi]|uniref:XRE family transcriptional regulator n=1 Tax=Lentibacillus salicampi TaxID=175306 RepID=A0A4Y9ACJ4_9BACI|nr:helix-turn-helix transcriptional regulator [Lentibacillus salicampi]TFJ92114.1 XRE family transcriptional regulator [Lentibacillus salicampi]